MPCNDCLDNCQPLVTDKCVKYTGPDVTELSIVYGDNLYTVEAAIIAKLLSFADGSGIDMSDVTMCQFLTTLLGGDTKTLLNVLQTFSDGICSLNTTVTQIQTQISQPTSFDTDCLDVPSSPTRDQILQATVSKVCELNTTITNIDNDYVKDSELCTKVTACIAANASNQEYLKMPKYCPIPYVGPLSVFDSAGKGLSAMGYDKVYLCIGQTINGFTLPDGRGRSPLGANTNIPTSGMDNTVNPSLNPGYSVSNKQKAGSYTTTLNITQIPNHSHTVTDPGHSPL